MNDTDKNTLKGIWESLLEHSDFSTTDDFFDVGGHSLLATELMLSIEKAFHVELPAETIFDHPTIEDLLEVISSKTQAA